jgi:hypothetical protein
MKSKDIFVFSNAIKMKIDKKSSFKEKDFLLREMIRNCLIKLHEINENEPDLRVAIKNPSLLSKRQQKLYWNRFALEKNIVAASNIREEILASIDSRIIWLGKGKKRQISMLADLLVQANYIDKNHLSNFRNNFDVYGDKKSVKTYVKKVKWNGSFFSLIYFIYLLRKNQLIDVSQIWLKLSKTFKKRNCSNIINTECPRLYNRITGYKNKATNNTIISFPKDATTLDDIINNILS